MLLIALGVTIPAWSQYDYDYATQFHSVITEALVPNCVSVREFGMGKIGVVGANESDALFSNPALIASFDKTSISVNGDVQAGFVSNERQEAVAQGYGANIPLNFRFGQISGAVPIALQNTPLTFGVGVGYGTAYDISRAMHTQDVEGVDNWTVDSTITVRGGLRVISPAIAIGIRNRYFVGITINQSLFSTITRDEKVAWNVGETESQYSLDNSALFVTIGAMAKIGEKLRAGISFAPGFEWKFAEEKFTMDQPPTEITDDAGGSITVPWVLGIGAQYRVLSQLELAAGFQTRMYQDMTRIEGTLDNGFAANVGAEYLLGAIPLRAGIFAESVPRTDLNFASSIKETSPRLEFGGALGASLPLKIAAIDAGLRWNHFSRSDNEATASYAYSEDRLQFNVGVSLHLPQIQFKAQDEFVPNRADTTTPEYIPEPGLRKPTYRN